MSLHSTTETEHFLSAYPWRAVALELGEENLAQLLLNFACPQTLHPASTQDRQESPKTQNLRQTHGGKATGLYELSTLPCDENHHPLGWFSLPVHLGENIRDFTDGNYDAMPHFLKHAIRAHIERTFPNFGKAKSPTLVSVRSGAEVSLPGAMSTILNVGISRRNIHQLEQRLGAVGAWEALTNFYLSFLQTVTGIEMKSLLDLFTEETGIHPEHQRNQKTFENLATFLETWCARTYGRDIPQNPWQQLLVSVVAVYGSFDRAKSFLAREVLNPAHTGLSVTEMRFGNAEANPQTISGSGQLHYPDVENLKNKQMNLQFALSRQGFAVVDDQAQTYSHIPKSLTEKTEVNQILTASLLKSAEAAHQKTGRPVDMEFVIENGAITLLQLRLAKTPPELGLQADLTAWKQHHQAHLNATLNQWILEQANPQALELAQRLHFDPSEESVALILLRGNGIGLSAVSGEAVILPEDAQEQRNVLTQVVQRIRDGRHVILVSQNINPNQLLSLGLSQTQLQIQLGVVAREGNTGSHAATIFRARGIPAIVGCQQTTGITDNMEVSLNSEKGLVYNGRLEVHTSSSLSPEECRFAKEIEAILGKGPLHQLAQKIAPECTTEKSMGLKKVIDQLQPEMAAKAVAQICLNIVFEGSDINSDYAVMKCESPSEIEAIKVRIRSAWEQRKDATIRSAYRNVAALGGNPWVVFPCQRADREELLSYFFTQEPTPENKQHYEQDFTSGSCSKSGTFFASWQKNPQNRLHEVIVGIIPKDKLNPAHAQDHYVAALTLSQKITPFAELQVVTGTANLRDIESDAGADRKILFHQGYNPITGKFLGVTIGFGRAHCNQLAVERLSQRLLQHSPKKAVSNQIRLRASSRHAGPGEALLHELVCHQLATPEESRHASLLDLNYTCADVEAAVYTLLGSGTVPGILLQDLITPNSRALASSIYKQLFQEKWQDLVTAGGALEEVLCEGSPITLEFQGRLDDGHNTPTLYGFKGYEEKGTKTQAL